MKKNKISLQDVLKSLPVQIVCGRDNDKAITGGYAGDLLSDVMANGKKGDIWITSQVHQNIVAVAVLKELAGIVIVGGKKPQAETINKGETEKITIATTPLTAFELAGKLYALGVSGTR